MTVCEKLIFCWLLTVVDTAVQAEITLDGSLGAKGVIPLQQNTYVIDSLAGKRAGGNLFHSFGRFNLEAGSTARFTDSTQSVIARVIGRVTGGEPSSIDGTLQSTIPNADFYLINPAGILFGPNAKLDVPGVFHASTATVLTLADGTEFSATGGSETLLGIAAPAAFGFLGSEGDIQLQGSQLTVANGLQLSAPSTTLDAARLSSYGGNISIDAVGDQAAIVPLQDAVPDLYGNITLTNSQLISEASETQSGGIRLKGGDITLSNALVRTLSQTATASGAIEINSTALNMIGSWLDTQTVGSANVGEIKTGSRAESSGKAGSIELDVTSLSAKQGSVISSEMMGENTAWLDPSNDDGLSAGLIRGKIGDLKLDASTLSISNGSQTSRGGGRIELMLGKASLSHGAAITSETLGHAQGGDIVINTALEPAHALSLSGRSRISASATENASGNAGSVQLFARSLNVMSNSQIASASAGSSDAGTVMLNDALHPGDTISITDGGQISVASSSGDAGNIEAFADHWLYLQNGRITTSSSDGFGNGGNISSRSRFLIMNASQIKADALKGDGGNIDIVSDFALISPGSTITASSDHVLKSKLSIQSQYSNIAGSIGVLPGELLDVSNVLNEDCAAAASNASSFMLGGRGQLPLSPESGISSLHCGSIF